MNDGIFSSSPRHDGLFVFDTQGINFAAIKFTIANFLCAVDAVSKKKIPS